MDSGLEKRAAPRVTLNSDAIIHIGGEQITCKTLNVAVKGIAVSCAVRRRDGCTIRIDFKLPNGEGWISTEAILIRSQSYYGFFIWGIQFQSLDERSRAKIQAYVSDNLGGCGET